MNIREATSTDIKQLAIHHRKMFEEMWEKKGRKLEAAKAQKLEEAYVEKLKEELPTGSYRAWIVEDDGKIAASGAISIVSAVPVPNDLNHRIANLHSVYTEKDCRGRKYAQRIIDQAIQYCRERGVNRIVLSASDAGKPIYEKLGFVSSPETMRLIIK